MHRRGGEESGRNNLDDVSLLMGRRLLRSVRGGAVSYIHEVKVVCEWLRAANFLRYGKKMAD